MRTGDAPKAHVCGSTQILVCLTHLRPLYHLCTMRWRQAAAQEVFSSDRREGSPLWAAEALIVPGTDSQFQSNPITRAEARPGVGVWGLRGN